MISRRPSLELSSKELILYDSIDGRKTVGELDEMWPGCRAVLLRWREAGIMELIYPSTSPAHPHIVVVEPHMDDAVLSAGGRLLHRRGRCRTTILTVFKKSNFTSYLHLKRDFLDVRAITELRVRESAFVARLLGAEHRALEWSEAPLRCWPAERWSLEMIERYNQKPEAFVRSFPHPREVMLIAEQLMQELEALKPDEFWFPMSLSDHVDHRATRNACLLLLAKDRNGVTGNSIVMYEDVPHTTGPEHAAQICSALAEGGTRLTRETEEITDVFEEKLRLISIFASQFKPSYMEPKVRRRAEFEGGAGGRFAEAYIRLEGKVNPPRESHLAREWAGLISLARRLDSVSLRRREWHRLVVIALPSTHLGTWRDNRQFLLAAFPNAGLHLYAPVDMTWQTEEGGIENLSLEFVRGGWRGWLGVLLREFFRFGTPTVVLWRGAYAGFHGKRENLINAFAKLINVLIKSVLPFRRVEIAKTLSDFCGVLNEQLAADGMLR